jgi:oxygen-independent coproporphyrinogen-3 oxidase
MVHSAYIHIPFCSHKCDFCDFAAFAGMDHLEDEYTSVVCEEIDRRTDAGARVPLQTVFYGGGTPGLVKPETIARIHERLQQRCGIADDAEVTIETTPHAISDAPGKIEAWSQIGINRISIGVETVHDSELKAIGRDHTRAQALEGIRLACENGCDNVSVDFMYALPTQTEASWLETLELFASLAQTYPQIKHVSAYGLHIANNSPLYTRFPRDCSDYPDDDSFDGMYRALVENMERSGFNQYEVSNFARAGHESTHNLSYWQNKEYYGFGVSAHRYISRRRSSNWRSLARYMKDFTGDETSEEIDFPTRMREAIMLALRMRRGLELNAFKNEFGSDLLETAKRPISKLIDGGFVELVEDHLRITQKGMPVSNSIIAELI